MERTAHLLGARLVSTNENPDLLKSSSTRYNIFMMDNKKIFNKIFCCVVVVFLSILTGCSTAGKQRKIIKLQKDRILNLQKQLKQKQHQVDQLKAHKWLSPKVSMSEQASLSRLQGLMAKDNWVGALKESAKLKKAHPQSRRLLLSRVKIFNKMGLKDQARKEYAELKKLQVQPAKTLR
ncbi:MAG: hypothetical protein KDD33_11755 [Bdellovibrionales bacterium]|nr:hypothetical protein [Bdellovibrionales bacterium]